MAEPANAGAQGQGIPGYRILVVDDEPIIRSFNTAVLVQSGYHVDVAEDGAHAWDTLQNHSYDLLITDNNMPKVTGIQLIKKVRGARMPLPIIMATGAMPKEEFTQNSGLHPVATLLKPYTLDDFLGMVKNVLWAAKSAEAGS
jgi:DNA-binding response OmpR family regulator